MPNQWKIDLSQYGISDAATQELRYFCLRYPEMQRRLAELRDPLRGMSYSGMPGGSGCGEPTAVAAEKAAELSEDCEMIEQAAIEADSGLYPWLLDAVTYGNSFAREKALGIPCGHGYFEKRRREFFYHLAVKRKII